jgi:hypothetical protein
LLASKITAICHVSKPLLHPVLTEAKYFCEFIYNSNL